MSKVKSGHNILKSLVAKGMVNNVKVFFHQLLTRNNATDRSEYSEGGGKQQGKYDSMLS